MSVITLKNGIYCKLAFSLLVNAKCKLHINNDNEQDVYVSL